MRNKVASVLKVTAITSMAAAIAAVPMLGKTNNIVNATTNTDENMLNINSSTTQEKPNVVYIVLDDLGFSDLGVYGSEIKTPNMDKLAQNGLRYNNFHTSPVCSPTRASLLTGRDSHLVGAGFPADVDLGPEVPNLRGQISPKAATIADVLKDEGYATIAVGKWHLTPAQEVTPGGPFNNWPLGKGFERYYGFLEGETDQYAPALIQDNSIIYPTYSEDYHFSEDMTDKAIQYIANTKSANSEKPFFLNFAFGAQHSPHQAPAEYIQMYDGVYDKGWDQTREERFERQQELGIIPEGTELSPKNDGIEEWDSLSDEEKEIYTQFMETYAGFLTHTDAQVGRLVDYLESIDELDNTLIMLIADNGASQEGGFEGSDNFGKFQNGVESKYQDYLDELDAFGGEKFQASYPRGWAQVSNTPFPGYKQTTSGGGTNTPLIVHWPERFKGLNDIGGVRNQYVHVQDITPTVYDLLKINAPMYFKGIEQFPISGKSFASTFNKADMKSKRDTQYFLFLNDRAIYHDGWKAVSTHKIGTSFEEDEWKLYHVAEDFSESKNLAEELPEKLEELKQLWKEEAEENGALPLVERTVPQMIASGDRYFQDSTYTYYEGAQHFGTSAVPKLANKSYTITVPINRSNSSQEGVLVAHGNYSGGYTFYIQDNKLVYEYNYFKDITRIESEIEVPEGSSVVSFEFEPAEGNSGTGKISIDGEIVGEALIPATYTATISMEGFDVGRDAYSRISESYFHLGDFAFEGDFKYVQFQFN